MNKAKLLVLLLVATLLLFPAIALAQEEPPCMASGKVTVDGLPAVDGTQISAIIGNETVATVATADGKYNIKIRELEGANYAGKTVTFMIGTNTAAQTITWGKGEVFLKDLTVGIPPITPGPGGTCCITTAQLGNTTGVSGSVLTIDKSAIKGDKGDTGTGQTGPEGPAGKSANSVIGIIAIIIAIIAVAIAVVGMMRKPQKV
jgi:hypothetical protein